MQNKALINLPTDQQGAIVEHDPAYIERDIVLVELQNVSVSGNDALVTDWHHRVWATSHDVQVRKTCTLNPNPQQDVNPKPYTSHHH